MLRRGPPSHAVKHTNRRYIVTLALVAAGILVFGSLLRPRQPSTDLPVPGLSQADRSRLARYAQRRELDLMTDYFRTVVNDANGQIVQLPSLNRTGLVWEPGVVLTVRTERRFPDAATLSTSTADIGVVPSVAGPHLPIVTLRTPEVAGFVEVLRRRAALLDPGSWTVALWRRNRELHFTPAHFLGVASAAQCDEQPVDELLSSVTWTEEMAGGGVFDLDGRLLGVIVPCGDRFVAVAAESIEMLLRQGSTVESRLVGRYGLRLGPLTEEEVEHYGSGEGVVVREVWTGYLAAQAGFMPGDIVVAINAEPIGSPEQLELLTAPAGVEAFDVSIRRQGRLVVVELPTDPSLADRRPVTTGASGLVWEPPLEGYVIDTVIPGSPADTVGIRPGDRLLRIDGAEPANLAHVGAVLAPGRTTPAFVELERRHRRWGVLLPVAVESEPSDG